MIPTWWPAILQVRARCGKEVSQHLRQQLLEAGVNLDEPVTDFTLLQQSLDRANLAVHGRIRGTCQPTSQPTSQPTWLQAAWRRWRRRVTGGS
jgi:hypothetical protein